MVLGRKPSGLISEYPGGVDQMTGGGIADDTAAIKPAHRQDRDQRQYQENHRDMSGDPPSQRGHYLPIPARVSIPSTANTMAAVMRIAFAKRKKWRPSGI
jgi:hypothetical protein